jgi:hypothetical protein
LNEELLIAAANNLAKHLYGPEVIIHKNHNCNDPKKECNCGYGIYPTSMYNDFTWGFGHTYEEALVDLVYKLATWATLKDIGIVRANALV